MFSLVASAIMVLNGKWWHFIVAVVSFGKCCCCFCCYRSCSFEEHVGLGLLLSGMVVAARLC